MFLRLMRLYDFGFHVFNGDREGELFGLGGSAGARLKVGLRLCCR